MHDLYIRFFRMAERRIAEKTGKRRSLFHLQLLMARRPRSFAGMRERFLEAFDAIRIDNLQWRPHTSPSMTTPDGRTSETSIFSTLRGQSPGIKVGTAITTAGAKSGVGLSRGMDKSVLYRDLWGQTMQELTKDGGRCCRVSRPNTIDDGLFANKAQSCGSACHSSTNGG